MKILYIANARLPTDNAHGVQIVKTCEALAKAGAEVTLLRPWRVNWIKEDVYTHYRAARTFKIVTLPSLDISIFGWAGFWVQMLSFSFFTFFYVLTHPPAGGFDVIYSRDEVPLYFASLVARHAYWESHWGRHNALIAHLLKRIEGLVVITAGLRDFYRERGVPEERMLVAPDAVALEDFAHTQSKEASRTRLGLPQDKQIALYIGKLDGWKGAETFCAASNLMPDVLCAVIGGEPAEIAALSQKYPKVTFLGWRPYTELPDNQAAGDVLVLPNSAKSEVSARFTSPLKLFTYLASGVPIVASDLPSIREVLDEQSAFFFAPDDPHALAEAVMQALSHPYESAEKARIARTHVERYTWDARADTMLTLLRNTVVL